MAETRSKDDNETQATTGSDIPKTDKVGSETHSHRVHSAFRRRTVAGRASPESVNARLPTDPGHKRLLGLFVIGIPSDRVLEQGRRTRRVAGDEQPYMGGSDLDLRSIDIYTQAPEFLTTHPRPAMDIDVDWCLTCQKHIEGDHPYCSFSCAPPASATCAVLSDSGADDDRPCSPSRWPGNDSSGIAAWAADIPPNAPPPADHFPFPATDLPQSPTRSQRAPPNLLNAPRRIAPPCLSVANLAPSSPPSRPPSAHPPTGTLSKSSSQTESPVSTPPSSHPHCHPSVPIFCQSRKSSIFGDMYIHVRSWVAPSPAKFVPVQIPPQQRPPLPDHHRVDSFSTFKFSLPPPTKKFQNCLGRGRHLPELAFNDHSPSFRARGRKASRAAA